MEWNVHILDEHWNPISEDVVLPVSILSKAGKNAVMLQGIDPYSITVFNCAQIEFFLPEWEGLAALVEPEDKATWQTVLEYAKRCLEPHLYLEFIGD
jgi:hypothetical protein